ncbi:hypothetical protein Tco_1329653 [Tanacetum coccineum]
MAEQDIPPPTITAMKIPIIKKREYDIWSMRMRQYICHTDHNLWDVIVNRDLEEEPAPTTGETSAPPAPKTAKQLEAIKSRFGGNVESKKMQKNVLKHQFEKFSTASNENLDKAYDRSSDEEITSANDRFSKPDSYHAVPNPITQIQVFTQCFIIVALEFSKGANSLQAKDDEDDVSEVIPETQNVKTQVDKIGQIYKKEGIRFKKIKSCFVCKSTDHLIRDYDFHEKRMAKQVELNKLKGKGTGQGEKRPVWNNVQRLNHQNNFVPKVVLTKTGRFPVNAARQNLSSQATTTSTARKVNTARPIVNEIRPRNNFLKSHSPNRRPFNRPTASKANPVKVNGVNTAKGNAVKSDVKGNWENVVKPSARCEWRPINVLDNVSKDSASMILKRVDYIDAHGRSKQSLKELKSKKRKMLKDLQDQFLTLKPLLKIDPKDKGKGVLEEEPKPGETQIERDLEIALKVQAELDEEARLERQRQEQASLNYIANLYDEVQARIDADHELAIRMTSLKTGKSRYKHAQLNKKTLEEIQMNKKVDGVHEEKVLEEHDSTKAEVKQEGNKEIPDEEGIIDYEVMEKRFPIINWESKFYHLDRHGAECIYYRIFRSDESSRWIKTFSEMVKMFDRLDLEELYNLVIGNYEFLT